MINALQELDSPFLVTQFNRIYAQLYRGSCPRHNFNTTMTEVHSVIGLIKQRSPLTEGVCFFVFNPHGLGLRRVAPICSMLIVDSFICLASNVNNNCGTEREGGTLKLEYKRQEKV